MSKTIACLFEALKMLYLVEPIYYSNWSSMKRILLSEISHVLKEKGAFGIARAKQIETFCLTFFYHLLSSFLLKRHFALFLFIHSLFIEQNNKKAKQSLQTKAAAIRQKASTDSMNSLFEDLPIKEIYDSIKHANAKLSADNCQKPSFLNTNSWQNCVALELNARFNGLSHSFKENAGAWLEYFQLNKEQDLLEKDIDLLNDCPFNNELSIFEKMIIWLCVRPEKVMDLSNFALLQTTLIKLNRFRLLK
jgi:hypothetical protein